MGIRVEHRPSAATLSDAAFLIGRTEAYRKQEEMDLKRQQLAQQMAQMVLDRKLRQQQLAEDRRQFDLRMQMAEQENLMNYAARQQDRELRLELERQEQERRLTELLLENKLYRDNLLFKHKLEMAAQPKYSPKQQERLDQLQNVRDWVQQKVRNGEWTPEEAKTVLDKTEMEILGIVPNQKTPTIDDDFVSRITVDPYTGKRWLLNKDKYEPLDVEEKPQKDTLREKIIDAVVKYASTPVTNDDGTTRMRTAQEVRAFRQQLESAFGETAEPTAEPPTEEQQPAMTAEPTAERQQIEYERNILFNNPALPPEQKVQIMQKYPDLATAENVADTAAKALAPQLKGKTPEQRRQLMRQWIAERFPGHPLLKERQKVELPRQPQMDAFQGMMQSLQPQIMIRGIP